MTRLPNFLKSRSEDMGLRHIKTARSVEEMNDAAKRGFRPILRQVVQNPEIRARFQVIQNHSTGEVRHLGDYRSRFDAAEWGVVIPWTDYYPYSWKVPFAAYLIPADIAAGDVVMLDDVIEDVIGLRWNQGSNFRLESCKARWTGSDLELILPDEGPRQVIG